MYNLLSVSPKAGKTIYCLHNTETIKENLYPKIIFEYQFSYFRIIVYSILNEFSIVQTYIPGDM